MRCNYCGKKLSEDTKVCDRCGKEVGKELTKLELIERKVKIIGYVICLIGWLEIVVNILLYVIRYFEKPIPTYIPDLAGLLYGILVPGIFIFLGNRIRSVYDKNIKEYLFSLLFIVAFLSLIGFINIDVVGMFILIYPIYALISYNKFLKDPEYKALLKDQNYKIKTIHIGLIVVLLLPLTWLALRYDIDNRYFEITPENIQKEVEKLKETRDLPMRIDSVTVCTDITADGEVIRYHLERSVPDGRVITKESLKESVIDNICSDIDILVSLRNGHKFEYLYTIKETGEEFLIEISERDCK